MSKQAVTVHIFFLCSYSVKSKQMCGDANDCEDTLPWEEDILQPLLAEYEPKDIFSADEAACFFKLCPLEPMHLLMKMLQVANNPKIDLLCWFVPIWMGARG